MIKIVNNVKFTFHIGKVEEIEADALFLWTTPLLNSGDLTFQRIHKEAGSVLFTQCLSASMKYGIKNIEGKEAIQVGQTVITDAGNLDFYNIVHCVLPNYRNKNEFSNRKALLANCLNMGVELVKAYGEIEYPLHSISILPIPPAIYGEVKDEDIKNVFTTLFSLTGIKKFNFVFESEEEYNIYSSIFNQLTTNTIERYINKLFKFKF